MDTVTDTVIRIIPAITRTPIITGLITARWFMLDRAIIGIMGAASITRVTIATTGTTTATSSIQTYRRGLPEAGGADADLVAAGCLG